MAFQEYNHQLNKRRWAHYLKVRKFDHPIVVRRRFAIGDVLLATPVISAIKRALPLAQIVVETDFPEILARNPDVKSAMNKVGTPADALIVDLNMAYENRPNMHIVDAYEQVAREIVPGLGPVEKRTRIYPDFGSKQWAYSRKEEYGGKKARLCVIHPGPTTWIGKNWPHSRFAEVATFMVEHGWHVVTVGGAHAPEIKNSFHLTGKTTIHQLAALLGLAQIFIGVDSFPMNCAMAMGCPTIGLFGITSSKYIMTGDNAIGVDGSPEVPCVGERHRIHGVTHIEGCREGIDSIHVAHVQAAVMKLFP
jgi:ADP-heptose:LPS heptosyltransferase